MVAPVLKMKYLICVLVLMISFVSAVTFDDTVVLNTTDSNSSVTFSVEVNVTNVTVESTYVYLYNVSYLNAAGFYDCGNVNHSDVNVVLDSADFNCTFIKIVSDEKEAMDEVADGPGGGLTYFPSLDDLIAGYTRNVREGFRLRVPINSDYHYVKVEDIEEAKVLVSVSSEVQEKWLSVGEEWFVEVDGDDVYDVYVKLNSISGLYASITVRKISEVIVSEEEVSVGEDLVEGEAGDDYNMWPSVLISSLVVVCLAVFVFLLVRNVKMSGLEKRVRQNMRFVRRRRKR